MVGNSGRQIISSQNRDWKMTVGGLFENIQDPSEQVDHPKAEKKHQNAAGDHENTREANAAIEKQGCQ